MYTIATFGVSECSYVLTKLRHPTLHENTIPAGTWRQKYGNRPRKIDKGMDHATTAVSCHTVLFKPMVHVKHYRPKKTIS